MTSDQQLTNSPVNPGRRRFVTQALGIAAAAALPACGEQGAPQPAASVPFVPPVGESYQFIQQKMTAKNKYEDIENINFKGIAHQLGGQPFTLSFITALCTAPVDGNEMVCDKMAKALATQSKKNNTIKMRIPFKLFTLQGMIKDDGIKEINIPALPIRVQIYKFKQT